MVSCTSTEICNKKSILILWNNYTPLEILNPS